MDQVPKSRCRTLVNATCICTDRNFYADTQACILEACEDTMDAIGSSEYLKYGPSNSQDAIADTD